MKHLLTLSIAFLISTTSFGAMFGKDQRIHVIEPEQEVVLLDTNGTQFVDDSGAPISGKLAYLTEIQFVFAGVWIEDQGYVIKGEGDQYYSILPEEQLAMEAYMGEPFPPYELSFMDYVFGYSLWLLIAGTILYYLLKRGFQRMRGEE